MASYSEIMKRKVAGIPVLYIVAVFVVVFAVVAWRMKSSAPAEVTDAAPEENRDVKEAANDPDYSSLETSGTVVAQSPPPEAPEPVVETNETWLRKAVKYLVDEENTNPGVAQTAMALYVEGENLSFEQGQLRDKAVRKLGLPPDGITRVGQTSAEPARKQFQAFPGTHTVRGESDNTISKLSSLYYGTADWAHYTDIMAANPTLGRSQTTPLNVGTKVNIPAFTPIRYGYVTKDTLTPTKFASKNGLSLFALEVFNPNMNNTPLKVGQRLRVS